MNTLKIIENALVSFESLTGLYVTIHDLSGNNWPYLKPERFHHRSTVCQAIKAAGFSNRCVKLEITDLRSELENLDCGRVHICHAGLVEWVVTVFCNDIRTAILFAGQCFPGKDLPAIRDLPYTHALKKIPRKVHPDFQTVGREKSGHILECLQQLSARLGNLLEECDGSILQEGITPQRRKQFAIIRFVRKRYHEPIGIDDLAKELSLSASRVSHLVKEIFGMPLSQLLREQRLKAAANQLRATDNSIDDIAYGCGFGDLSHFYRYFKQYTGKTPSHYRHLQE